MPPADGARIVGSIAVARLDCSLASVPRHGLGDEILGGTEDGGHVDLGIWQAGCGAGINLPALLIAA
jgi:hypothetical protein